MPTYSYRCTECDTAFDIQQSFTDDSLTVCPNCGGRLRKVFSSIGVSFTGSGFYRNDSRASVKPGSEKSSDSSDSSDSGSSGSSSSSDSSSGSGSPSTSEKKSDKKTETKSAPAASSSGSTGSSSS